MQNGIMKRDDNGRGVRNSKLIDGALDELPPPGEATEDQLRQWLEFFEGALRVVYRLPVSRGQN